jgi:hypothetical protein
MGAMKVAYPSVEELEATGPAGQTRTPPRPNVAGNPSLEVRWIFAGRVPGVMAGWISGFPARTIALEDAYLVNPLLPGPGVP